MGRSQKGEPATKKPTSLSEVMAKKAAVVAEPVKPSAVGDIKTLTLRLPEVVHERLREMAYTAHRSQHSLLMEAVNLLFERHGKPPIAPNAS